VTLTATGDLGRGLLGRRATATATAHRSGGLGLGRVGRHEEYGRGQGGLAAARACAGLFLDEVVVERDDRDDRGALGGLLLVLGLGFLGRDHGLDDRDPLGRRKVDRDRLDRGLRRSLLDQRLVGGRHLVGRRRDSGRRRLLTAAAGGLDRLRRGGLTTVAARSVSTDRSAGSVSTGGSAGTGRLDRRGGRSGSGRGGLATASGGLDRPGRRLGGLGRHRGLEGGAGLAARGVERRLGWWRGRLAAGGAGAARRGSALGGCVGRGGNPVRLAALVARVDRVLVIEHGALSSSGGPGRVGTLPRRVAASFSGPTEGSDGRPKSASGTLAAKRATTDGVSDPGRKRRAIRFQRIDDISRGGESALGQPGDP